MRLRQLHYFKVIVELKNFTRAAEKLMISQPSLSRSMADLEAELGVPLFLKSGRNIEPSAYSLEFLKYVDNAFLQLEEGKKAIGKMLNPNAGLVRLGFVDTFAKQFIPNLVKAFYRDDKNRDIVFGYTESQTMPLIDLLKKREIDVGFGAFVDDPALEFYLVMEEEMFVAVSTEHAFSQRDSIDLQELAAENIVTYNYKGGTRRYIDGIFASACIVPKIVSEVDTDTMIASIVSANFGVGIMPNMLGLDMFNIKLLRCNSGELIRPLYMVWLRDAPEAPVAENFKKFVMAEIPAPIKRR